MQEGGCNMLDDIIQAAASKAAAEQQKWTAKHIPLKVNDTTVWVSTEIPADIQRVLNVLPDTKEAGTVKRSHQIKSRLSDEELESFELLVKTSGLSQTDYIRGMVLNGTVEVTQTSLVDAQALEELTSVSSTLGKIAGMIRMTVITNKEFAVLTSNEKKQLEHQLRSLRHLQTYIQALAEKIYGHL